MLNIRPVSDLRNRFSEVEEDVLSKGEPVFLTKNGEGDLVVMDIETFNRREKMLKLREELLAVFRGKTQNLKRKIQMTESRTI